MEQALTVLALHIIRFGGISEQVFTFTDGVNVIYGENRSGKTTLCEFIRFMYYGFEGRDADDYYPYNSDNRSVCGSMKIKFGAHTVEIFREKSVQGEMLALTDTEKGTPFDIGDKSPGEFFLGLAPALYDKSLYCPQDMAGLVSSGDLVDYEKDLIRAYSGEDNFSSLAAALRGRMNELRNPEKSGKIDIALAKREQLDADLTSAIIKQTEIMNVEALIADTSEKLLDAEKRIVLAKADIESLHEMHVDENVRRVAEAEKNVDQKREKYEELAKFAVDTDFLSTVEGEYDALCRDGEELERMENRLANTKSNLDMHNDMMDTEEYDEEQLENVARRVENHNKIARNLFIFALSSFVLGAVAFVLLFGVFKLTPSLSVGIPSAFLTLSFGSLIAAAVLILTKNLLYKTVGALTAEDFEELCETFRSMTTTADLYRTTYRDEARAYKVKAESYSVALSSLAQKLGLNRDAAGLDDIAAALDAAKAATLKAQNAKTEYDKARERLEKLGAADIRHKNEEYTELLKKHERELGWYTNQRESLFEKKRSLEEIFSTAVIHTERPVYIKTRLDEINAELEEYNRDHAALSVAAEVLDDALGVMKFRIKSHLSDGVNHNMKFALKDDEYFVIDDDYALQYKNSSRLIPVFTDSNARSTRAAKGLSRSLCETAAIALRLALVELLEVDTCAAVFDEPFAFIDPEGEGKMIKKLSNSGITQVFLFTSHNVPNAEEKYNLIKLTLN